MRSSSRAGAAPEQAPRVLCVACGICAHEEDEPTLQRAIGETTSCSSGGSESGDSAPPSSTPLHVSSRDTPETARRVRDHRHLSLQASERDAEHEVPLWQASVTSGDPAAALFEVVYAELRDLAGRVMASERDEHTLQPTALVHEAFVKLVGMEALEVRGRDQFLSLAARAMRRVLVDHARTRGRTKRGRGWGSVALEGVGEASAEGPASDPGRDLLDVDAALECLAQRAARAWLTQELEREGR